MSCRYEIFSHYMVLKISFYSATHLTDWETQPDSSSWSRLNIVPVFSCLWQQQSKVFTDAAMDIYIFSFYISLPCLPLCLLEGKSELRLNIRKTTQHEAEIYLPSWVSCLWTDTVYVPFLKPPGQTMFGYVLLSLSAFNSQLTALIATAPCLLLNPGAILHLSQTIIACTEIQLFNWLLQMKLDRQPEVSPLRTDIYFLTCSMSVHLCFCCNMDTVSDRYCLETLTKSLVRSGKFLCIPHINKKACPGSKTTHHHAGQPSRGFNQYYNTSRCIQA